MTSMKKKILSDAEVDGSLSINNDLTLKQIRNGILVTDGEGVVSSDSSIDFDELHALDGYVSQSGTIEERLTGLDGKIDTEISRATAAEDALDARVDTLEEDTVNAAGTYLSKDDGNRALYHNATPRMDTTSSATINNGASFTVVDSVSDDENGCGHLTGINVKTITLPTISAASESSLKIDGANTSNPKVNHDVTIETPTTSLSTIANGGSFTAIDGIIKDGNGHVTKYNTKTVTIPTVTAGTGISISGANTSTPTINHSATIVSDTNNSTTLGNGGSFPVVDAVTRDSTGHVTTLHTETITLPTFSAGDGIKIDTDGLTFKHTNVAPQQTDATATQSVANVQEYTYDGQGHLTASTLKKIQITEQQVTNLVSDLSGKAPVDHASEGTTYGVGTPSLYGHVMFDERVTPNRVSNSDKIAISEEGIIDFVNQSVNNIAAYYITYHIEDPDTHEVLYDGPFPNHATLLSASASELYSGGHQRTPTRNDYTIVSSDESHEQYDQYDGYVNFDTTMDYIGHYIEDANSQSGYKYIDNSNYNTSGIVVNDPNLPNTPAYERIVPSTRYIYNSDSSTYSSSNWNFQYTFNQQYTQAQMAALNSGITAAKVDKLDTVERGAEVNVNADWDASSGDAEILNKPTTIAGYGITDAVQSNTAITADTKCKITYDTKGLVTAGADLIESDIPALSISKTTGLQTALDNKLDDNQLVTAWQSTVSDSNIPSEKLVKHDLDLKVDKTTTVNGYALSNNISLSKSDVGLGNCDNTSDLDKPISTATQTALDAKVTGASSSVDGNVAFFDGTTGKLVKDSGFTIPAPSVSNVDKALIVGSDGNFTYGGAGLVDDVRIGSGQPTDTVVSNKIAVIPISMTDVTIMEVD